ncbi:unnamed protein product [Mytilus coruscus]|uniref:OTU domain-containing protein n=1 Tax=Mytilus coruscus TaxID=42192 RepID=A0A6J8DDX8_MYTCO|nr:unnamed protein product [Mytilus coruscus]
MTAHKKRKINERRRQKYAEKKRIKIRDDSEKQQSLSSVSPGYITKETERKAMCRAKKSLPTSLNKFASVLSARSSIVSDAEDFYKYASDELSIQKGEEDDCCHKIRSFFLVDEKDVIRKRQDRIEVKAVPDTRKKHAIKPVANGNLVTRLLSCFCDGCITQNGECLNNEHVENWEGIHKQDNSTAKISTVEQKPSRTSIGLNSKDAFHPDFTSWLPVQVIGDGNCLPRSASVACFGKETDHQEIRVRIVIGMCLHVEKYTSNEYLNRGIDLPKKEGS